MVTGTSVTESTRAVAPIRERLRLPDWGPWAAAALVCAALGAISVLTLPSVPDYDEFSWLVWGREIAHQLIGPHQPFNLLGGPSWKPFPALFTTIFGFFGASVTLWVAFVRAAGLFGLWLAYRAAARLAGTERWPAAGPVAGTLAAVAVCLTLDWFHFMFRGTSEPLTITATLLWVERLLAGRRLQALLAGMVLATMRPEAGFFVAIYGLWLLWREPTLGRRLLAAGGVLLVPLAWIVPPWIANGQPLQASSRARAYAGNQGHEVATFVLRRAVDLTVWPVTALALGLLVWALWRRERTIIGLAASSLAYVGVIELMALHGFPGLPRFMLPAASIACVLAAVAVARLATLLGGGIPSALAAAAIVALATPFCIAHASRLVPEERLAVIAARWDHALVTAVHRAGGARLILPCRRSRAAVNHIVQPSLAWDLAVPLNRVRPLNSQPDSLNGPVVAFLAHGNPIVGLEPSRLRTGFVARPVTRWKMWHVVRITGTGDARANACTGDRAAASRAPVGAHAPGLPAPAPGSSHRATAHPHRSTHRRHRADRTLRRGHGHRGAHAHRGSQVHRGGHAHRRGRAHQGGRAHRQGRGHPRAHAHPSRHRQLSASARAGRHR